VTVGVAHRDCKNVIIHRDGISKKNPALPLKIARASDE
jgi:hypothetical protein